jgi:alkanesulfonate monooxygenase SsuD/methylene tetrahydromethanopterin reductase-like flavin-dependent oxidoreductase (luciferase family)
MLHLGYKLSSEEFGPSDLIQHAARAEAAGFDFALISDHFHPWSDRQGQSPFVWSVLGGVPSVTKRLSVGTGATCPILRTHRAIVAQRDIRPRLRRAGSAPRRVPAPRKRAA